MRVHRDQLPRHFSAGSLCAWRFRESEQPLCSHVHERDREKPPSDLSPSSDSTGSVCSLFPLVASFLFLSLFISSPAHLNSLPVFNLSKDVTSGERLEAGLEVSAWERQVHTPRPSGPPSDPSDPSSALLILEGHFILFMHMEILRKGRCIQTENNWIPTANSEILKAVPLGHVFVSLGLIMRSQYSNLGLKFLA